MLCLCHRGTKTENHLLPFYFSRHVDHSTLHLSLLPLYVYDSISVLAVWSWSTSICSSKVNQQLQEGRTQISHGSCQQQQEKHSTEHNVLLSETTVSWQKFGVSHWKISGPDSQTIWYYSSRYIQSQLQKIRKSDLYFRVYNFTVKESLSSHWVTNTIDKKFWSVHFTTRIILLIIRYRGVWIHMVDFMP